jgi:hypothetical protein
MSGVSFHANVALPTITPAHLLNQKAKLIEVGLSCITTRILGHIVSVVAQKYTSGTVFKVASVFSNFLLICSGFVAGMIGGEITGYLLEKNFSDEQNSIIARVAIKTIKYALPVLASVVGGYILTAGLSLPIQLTTAAINTLSAIHSTYKHRDPENTDYFRKYFVEFKK